MKAAALDKVRKLLALAADGGASEDEARTAAVLAARLIAEHGLVVVVQGFGGAQVDDEIPF